MSTDTETVKSTNMNDMEQMFKAGVHFGYAKSRRHPSAKPYIFGAKNRMEIFDLEKVKTLLDEAKDYVRNLGQEGKTILFVTGKNEAKTAMIESAEKLEMPYVAGRWIGGTLTNFSAIRSRVDLLEDLLDKKAKGELTKYTKKERLLIDRDIEKLLRFFGGIRAMKKKPDAFLVIDSKREFIAIEEAKKSNVPIVALLGSDCDSNKVDYPIFGNDSNISSIKYFVDAITEAYLEGKKMAVVK